ncbi:hypothetical protein BDV93DRAFT_539996 [Ceratobasidium sp. AG-I]|nr:hypothetical protein BDV93DRAFT_539996 [Ceratobasidium sp. AG-I]
MALSRARTLQIINLVQSSLALRVDQRRTTPTRPTTRIGIMGGRLVYLDVDDERIVQIFERSRRKRIWGYGYFVNILETCRNTGRFSSSSSSSSEHSEYQPTPQGFSHHTIDGLKNDLLDAGIHTNHIISWCTPKSEYDTITYPDYGWLVLLGAGLSRSLHVPVAKDVEERVKVILGKQTEPTWWKMKSFSYPPARDWIAIK